MDAIAARPSSWPVRRERRNLAVQSHHQEVKQMFLTLQAQLQDVLDQVAVLHTSSTMQPPPGLICSQSILLDERVSRLETLFVCKPSIEVDEVLEELLSRKSAQCSSEPEREISPTKQISIADNTASAMTIKHASDDVQKSLFDIFEERADVQTQTHDFQDACEEVGTQCEDGVDTEVQTECDHVFRTVAKDDADKEGEFTKLVHEVKLADDWEPMMSSTREPEVPTVIRVGKTFTPFCFDDKVADEVVAGSLGVISRMGADYSMYIFFPDLAVKKNCCPWRWVHRVHSVGFDVGWPAKEKEIRNSAVDFGACSPLQIRKLEHSVKAARTARESNGVEEVHPPSGRTLRKERQLARRCAKVMM